MPTAIDLDEPHKYYRRCSCGALASQCFMTCRGCGADMSEAVRDYAIDPKCQGLQGLFGAGKHVANCQCEKR